jgi:hypothetical protein
LKRGNHTRIIPGHKGAFEKTAFYVITQATERHGIESAVCRWISTTLENIITPLSGETMRVFAARGFPQGRSL